MTLDKLAGYLTEKSVWMMIAHLANVSLRGDGKVMVSPKTICFDHDSIRIVGGENTKGHIKSTEGAEEAVWTIGSLAFYALIGTEVFDGQGMNRQKGATEVPRIGTAHCSRKLSDIIFRCLSFSPTCRPTLDELIDTANKALQQPSVPRKKVGNGKGVTYKESIVKFWPDEMYFILIFLVMSFTASLSFAQAPKDVTTEMMSLIQRSKSLRSVSNKAKVSRELLYDMEWTLMDEIDIDRQGECTTKDPVDMFGINDLGYKAVKLHGGSVNAGGRFRNGQDARYKYSFIEITVKKGASVNYDITGRQGIQTFAVIPFDPNAIFSAKLTKSGSSFSTQTTSDGVAFVRSLSSVKRSDTFRLSIKNSSAKNMAFIIINYNPGK